MGKHAIYELKGAVNLPLVTPILEKMAVKEGCRLGPIKVTPTEDGHRYEAPAS